eukprot:2456790-Pleurochrysis_carterae.AAC.4
MCCRSGWVAIRTTRAPERAAKSLSWNCVLIVHGIMSPEGISPRPMAFATLSFEISPSSESWTTASTSGSVFASTSTGPSSTKSWCAGASDMRSSARRHRARASAAETTQTPSGTKRARRDQPSIGRTRKGGGSRARLAACAQRQGRAAAAATPRSGRRRRNGSAPQERLRGACGLRRPTRPRPPIC